MEREFSTYTGLLLLAIVGLAYWWGVKCDSGAAGDLVQRAAGILPHALPNSINFTPANPTDPRTGYPAGTLPGRPDLQVLPTNAAQ